jgi:hypothetical protein
MSPTQLDNPHHRTPAGGLERVPCDGGVNAVGPDRADRGARSRLLMGIRACRHVTQLSWPKRYPIVQFPNAPLILAFLAGHTAAVLHGAAHPYASAVAYLAMIVWAYEEMAHGVNRLRNALGLAYTISTVVHLAVALHR